MYGYRGRWVLWWNGKEWLPYTVLDNEASARLMAVSLNYGRQGANSCRLPVPCPAD